MNNEESAQADNSAMPPLAAAHRQQAANAQHTVQEELKNPVIKDDDPEMDRIMKAAEYVDRGEEVPAELRGEPVAKEEPAAEAAAPEITPTEVKSEIEGERKRDEFGRFTKEAPEGSTSPATTSEYEQAKQAKAAKDKERQDRSWEALNREKEQFAQQRAAELAAIEAEKQKVLKSKVRREFTAEQLWSAYEDFAQRADAALEQGDYETHAKELRNAKEAFKSSGEFYAAEQQEAQEIAWNKHLNEWRAHREQAFKDNADLNNPESALYKAVDAVFTKNKQRLSQFPDGFAIAVEHAKGLMYGDENKTLKEKLAAKDKEIERLNGATAPAASSPAGRSRNGTDLDSMSEAEQQDYFMRRAEEYDARNR